MPRGNIDTAVRVEALDVRRANPNDGAFNRGAERGLRHFDRLTDGSLGRFNIDDVAFFPALGIGNAQRAKLKLTVVVFRRQYARLRTTRIHGDNVTFGVQISTSL